MRDIDRSHLRKRAEIAEKKLKCVPSVIIRLNRKYASLDCVFSCHLINTTRQQWRWMLWKTTNTYILGLCADYVILADVELLFLLIIIHQPSILDIELCPLS